MKSTRTRRRARPLRPPSPLPASAAAHPSVYDDDRAASAGTAAATQAGLTDQTATS